MCEGGQPSLPSPACGRGAGVRAAENQWPVASGQWPEQAMPIANGKMSEFNPPFPNSQSLPAAKGGQSGASAQAILLFSESNTRFLCEVPPEKAVAFEAALVGVPHAKIGEVVAADRLIITDRNTRNARRANQPGRIERSLAEAIAMVSLPIREHV